MSWVGITICPNGHRFGNVGPPGINCPACELAGTYVKLSDEAGLVGTPSPESLEALVTPVSQIDLEAVPALEIHGFKKLQAALNGVRRRTVYLTSGDPGVGKSTLLTQLGLLLHDATGHGSVLYVAAEEPREAVAERARRLCPATGALGEAYLSLVHVLESGDLAQLEAVLSHEKAPPYSLVVVDSIQTVWSPRLDSVPGSVSQVVACTNACKRIAREYDLTVWLLAHVTKDGSVAGPKSLEHLVDVVAEVEVDETEHISQDRILYITKNRRGKLADPVRFTVQPNGGWRER